MSTATTNLLILVLAVATPLFYGSVQHIVGGNAGWSTVVNNSVWSAGQRLKISLLMILLVSCFHMKEIIKMRIYI